MIKELHDKIVSGAQTSQDLTDSYLKKIETSNGQLNAYLDVYSQEAMQQARSVDEKVAAGKSIGILEGIPCALKDNLCLKGKKTTAASKILEKYLSPYDATAVSRLKDSGAVFLGKTNLDEFAMGSSTENSAFGPSRNPHDHDRVPGGSSGGSAVAVAGDLAAWALGSDTGGSIRQPSGLCGVVGLKPTYGRVSRYGLIAMASSYDQIGPITKTVEDAAIVLDAIAGKDPMDNTTLDKPAGIFLESLSADLRGKRLGIVKGHFSEGLDNQVKEIIQQRIDWAAGQGAEIVEIELPNTQFAMGVYYLMVPSEISSNMARYDGIKYGFSEAQLPGSKSRHLLDVYLNTREAGLGAEVKRRVILGTYALSAGYYDAYYKKAQKVRELIKRDYQQAFDKVDAIITPTSPSVAFKSGEKTDNPLEMYLEDVYTVPINVAGIPAISIPAGFLQRDGSRLPVGLQVLGPWWDEQTVLDVAAAMEIQP